MEHSTEYMKQFFELIRDERMTHANTATRVGNAFLMLLHYLLDPDTPFLRKDQEDKTEFLLRLIAGAVIGESGQIRLRPDGSIECCNIFVSGSAIFNELVFNHQNVLEGDTYFTDRGIVDDVLYRGNGQYTLTMRKMYDDDVITFHVYDVLKGSMNNLDRAKTFKTSWMRVDAIDNEAGTMDVTLYDDEDVPGGVNFAPEPSARLIRWGNQLDESRQSVFFISAQDGRFLFLQGVTQPILHDGNYSAFIGLPPELECLKNVPLNKRQPYVYAKGLIVQDIIKVDYMGNPEYNARDCGTWDAGRQYIHGFDEAANGWYSDRVWWGGCLWQCSVDKATVGKEPRFNNADWACLLGGANMALEIVSSGGDFFPAGRQWQTTLIAELWNAEMRISEDEIGRENISWTRLSGDEAGDAAWNLKHAPGTIGFELGIDSLVDVGTWEAGSTVGFQCEVFIREKGQSYSQQYSVIM